MAISNTIFSSLLSIQAIARALSESHLDQHYTNADCGPALQSRIASALRNLSQCLPIINDRASIARVPQDVLGLIFYAVKDDNPSDELSTLHLSRVSRQWHCAAVQNPLLWTSVKATIPFDSELLTSSLSMSRLFPIDLTIEVLDGGRIFEDRDIEKESKKLRTALEQHISRCRSIKIKADVSLWSLLNEFRLHFQTSSAPLLETFSFSAQDPGKMRPGLGGTIFQSVPKLYEIRMSPSAVGIFHPPLENITSLRLEHEPHNDIYSSTLYDLLSRSSALETMSLLGGIVVDRWSVGSGKLSLPKLRSLSLSWFPDSDNFDEFLSYISAPVLDTLLIDGFWDFVFGEIEDLEPLPFPSLTALTLSVRHCFDDDDVLDALRMASSFFPHVEELTLTATIDNDDKDSLMPSLMEVPGHLAWPRLQQLSLGDIFFSEVSENALYKFVTLRKEARIPLQQLILHPKSIERLTRLDWLKSQVEVVVRDQWSADLASFGIDG